MRLAKITGQIAAAAMAAGVVAAGGLALAGSASASTASTTSHSSSTVENLHLQAMPAGSVLVFRSEGNSLAVQVTAFGFTPGSSHTVELVRGHHVLTQFQPLTANALPSGGIDLTAPVAAIPPGSQIVILNGTASDPVSTEPIAETGGLFFPGISTYQLHSVEVSPNGTNYGTPRGRATFVYNPTAQTITVTVNASGLTPGLHAAHIHDGSCMSQGPVQYMLMDFMANGQGRIVNQTRTVTGVTGPEPATGWYLNLHQGNSNNILANGQPTINFRPLLCADI
jgi:hypothetical protein